MIRSSSTTFWTSPSPSTTTSWTGPPPPASVPNCGTSWKAPQPSRRNALPTHRELPARTGGLGPPQRIPPQHMAAVLHAGKSHGGDVPHLAVAQRGRPDYRGTRSEEHTSELQSH